MRLRMSGRPPRLWSRRLGLSTAVFSDGQTFTWREEEDVLNVKDRQITYYSRSPSIAPPRYIC